MDHNYNENQNLAVPKAIQDFQINWKFSNWTPTMTKPLGTRTMHKKFLICRPVSPTHPIKYCVWHKQEICCENLSRSHLKRRKCHLTTVISQHWLATPEENCTFLSANQIDYPWITYLFNEYRIVLKLLSHRYFVTAVFWCVYPNWRPQRILSTFLHICN